MVTQPPRPIPDPRPHQWVYTKELRVMYDGGGKPFTHEHWIRVDGRKFVNQQHNAPRAARAKNVRKDGMDFPPSVSARWPRCPPGKRERLARVRPAVGLGHFFRDPSAVPTDPDGLLAAVYQLVEDPTCAPIAVGDTVQNRAFMLIDGMLQTVLPAEVRAALYRALAKIPGVKAEVARRRRRRPKSAKNAAASHGSIARSAPSATGPPPEAAMHSQALPNPAPAGNAQGNPSELRDATRACRSTPSRR